MKRCERGGKECFLLFFVSGGALCFCDLYVGKADGEVSKWSITQRAL